VIPYRVEGPLARAWYELARRRAQRRRDGYRARLEREDFSIVCANCWGAEAYRHLELPYLTPFVGLFVEAPCYMRLLGDLRGFLAEPFTFAEHSRYPHINVMRAGGRLPQYPIGVLRDEVEIHFLHYDDRDEAADKWARRATRVNWENLHVSLLEHGARETAVLGAFDALPEYDRKLVLTPNDRRGIASAWRVRGSFSNAASVYYQALSQFDVTEWLNSGRIGPPAT
jgi:uncharacterized protein (DUF1919 family)